MPAPAVYVLAVLGTAGAIFAFKEFVYEPHIAPAIERWIAERHASASRRETEVQMSETSTAGSRPSKSKFSDDEDSSDDEGNPWNKSKLSKDGLLSRPQHEIYELDDIVATEMHEWRNAGTAQDQVLRQRKNISEHAMDESVQAIPYSPISPHVLFDPSSPVSSSSATQSLPQSPSSQAPRGLSLVDTQGRHPSPSASPTRHSSPHATASTHRVSSPQSVPSLSQSYPQDLDYEHGLELLSPPSSRADTPFSMADISPREGLQALSGTSASSSTVSSPAPFAMGLGNQSYDVLSPPMMHLAPSLAASNKPASATNSARSTTYLSFSDSEPSSPLPAPPTQSIHSPLIRNLAYAEPSTISPPQSGLGLLHVPIEPQPRFATPTPSESDLSDLDFMSDYQPSEPAAHLDGGLSRTSSHAGMSDAGHESDSSWSMAGSNVGSPVMVSAPRPRGVSSNREQGAGLTRGGTIRQSQLPFSRDSSS